MLLLVVGGGCATMKSALPKLDDVAVQRRERNDAITRDFNAKRDTADLELARALRREGDPEGAIDRLRQIVVRSPDHLDARLLLTEQLADDGRRDEAVEVLLPAAESHPHNARVQRTMDLLLDADGDGVVMQDGHIELPRLTRPVQPTAILQTVCVVPAGSSATTGAAAPMPPGVPGIERSAISEFNGKSDAADRGRSPRPASAERLIDRGSRALAAGDVESAVNIFREAVAHSPHDRQIPITAAVALLRQNEPERAVELLEPLEGCYAASAAFWRVLATARYRRGDFKASQVALEQALSLDKSNALAYFLMGSTCSKLGQAEAAVSYFRKAEQLDPRYTVRR